MKTIPAPEPDEAIRGWVRGRRRRETCAWEARPLREVQERTRNFLTGLANWKDEVRRGYRTVLQSGAERSCDTRGPTLGALLGSRCDPSLNNRGGALFTR